MALRTPPSWLQNGSHPAENDRLGMQAIWATTGIVTAASMAVTAQSTPNMTVNVASGWAAVVGTTQSNMGVYTCFNDATQVLTITTAPVSNSRIDLICATINDAYYTGSTNNVVFQVIAGTVAASPVAPTLPANSISLATVLVGTGVTSISAANITDTRVLTTTNIPVLTSSGVATLTNKTLVTPLEKVTINTGAVTGTLQFDTVTQADLYFTTAATGNPTINIRGNSTTTLNSLLTLGTNNEMTVVVRVTNGATAYYIPSITIDGTATGVSTKWSGGSAPTFGNANGVDVYTFNIIKTANTPTYTVFATGPNKWA
jgi:hypothetical protein